MPRMNGWQAVVAALQSEGIEHVFGLPGNPLHLYDALYDVPEIKPVLVRHECSGAFMASAYARVRGGPAVCFASPGPGVANLVSGVLEAYSACLPLVIPCPSVGTNVNGLGAFQEVDQVAMFRPITKWAIRVEKADRIPWTMQRAFSVAVNGKPGPVFVDLPGDLALQETEMPDYRRAERSLQTRANVAAIGRAAVLLSKARKPVIVAGGGAVLSGAFAELAELVELLGAPVLTTPAGRGSIPEDHPLALGLVGLYFTRVGKEAYDEADLILGVGSRFEEFQSGAWRFFPPGAKFIQIDVDPFEIGRNFNPDVALVGDARLVLQDILQVLRSSSGPAPRPDSRAKELAAAKAKYESEIARECQDAARPIKAKRVVREVNEVFGRDTILVNENGSLDVWSYCAPYYKVLDLRDCVPPAEQTCMGAGVAGAIGAKLAKPEKKVVCVTGDAAFQMFMKELPTAMQYKAPVTWVVLDNAGYGWPKFIQRLTGERYIGIDFEVQPDFVSIATASRCYGERIEDPEEVKPALNRALSANAEGLPAVLSFAADSLDLAEGFVSFHQEIRGLGRQMNRQG